MSCYFIFLTRQIYAFLISLVSSCSQVGSNFFVLLHRFSMDFPMTKAPVDYLISLGMEPLLIIHALMPMFWVGTLYSIALCGIMDSLETGQYRNATTQWSR